MNEESLCSHATIPSWGGWMICHGLIIRQMYINGKNKFSCLRIGGS